MATLHHLSIAADDPATWAVLADALVGGDLVVVLDRAAAEIHQSDSAIAWSSLFARHPGVRWLLPVPELPEDGATVSPMLEVIDEEQWLALIVAHPVLLEWS